MQAAADVASRRLTFLAEASERLAASLDYEATLVTVVDLPVPVLADCCILDIVEVERKCERLVEAAE